MAALAVLLAATAPVLAQEACSRPDALGTSRVMEVNPAGGLKIGLKSYPQTLALEKGEVVLTFDDGPLPATTGPILKALDDECVKATFFLVGRNAQANPTVVQREIERGHTVGHHSFSHPFITMRGLSEAAAKADLEQGFAADDRALGGPQSGVAPRTPFFRYPGFADTPELNAWLASRNVAIFGADLWASDWVDMTPQKTMELLLARLDHAGKGIILLHDTRPQTAKMLPALLRELKTRGYKVVHIVPAKGDAPTALAKAEPGWTSETEANIAKVWPKILAEKRRLAKGTGQGVAN
jgi:peptidoglycan/xylan/chitin deacetylase (PgdA/CDA1 family)